MTARFALDSSVAVELLRGVSAAAEILSGRASLPLPVAGELFAGAYASQRPATHLQLVQDFIARCDVVNPDRISARLYGELRARLGVGRPITPSKTNDLWIAAICIQHDLPLLTRDHGFDHIAGLRVLHW